MFESLFQSCAWMRRNVGVSFGALSVLTGCLMFGCASTTGPQSSVAAGSAAAETKGEEQPESVTFTGRCLCGAVTYRVEGVIRDMNYCDCRGCQVASGAFKAPWVVVHRDAMAISGETARVRGDRKRYPKCDRHGERVFCPRCGTQLCWYPDRGSTVDITAGTMDDTSIFKVSAD